MTDMRGDVGARDFRNSNKDIHNLWMQGYLALNQSMSYRLRLPFAYFPAC